MLTAEYVLSQFDEAAYLAGNPDVAAAVAAGHFPAGRDHFVSNGLQEGRAPCPVDRRARLLGQLDPARLHGVEIGVLDNPTVHKGEGSIVYVDHTSREGLAEIYRSTGMDLATILDVDAVWGDKRLRECLPNQRPVDYVIASHVIEHVPDLLGWLQEIREILGAGGQVRLAIPDRRYTFDILRRESQLPDVLDAYLRKARAPLPRAVLEFVLWTRAIKARDAWLGLIDLEALRTAVCPAAEAMELARQVLEEARYIDSHCWVFTPRSFAALMEQLAAAGLLGFACAEFHDTVLFDHEFFVGLAATGDAGQAARSWRAMHEAAAA